MSKTETNSLDHIDGQDDWELCVYYLNLISNVLQYSSSNVWLALASMASSGSNGMLINFTSYELDLADSKTRRSRNQRYHTELAS